MWTQHCIKGRDLLSSRGFVSLPPTVELLLSRLFHANTESALGLVSAGSSLVSKVLQTLSHPFGTVVPNKCEFNLVQYREVSVSLCVGIMPLSNWSLISIERRDWMSVWAGRIHSTAVSGLGCTVIQHSISDVRVSHLIIGLSLIYKATTISA